jgi:hypothetical protein
VTCRTFAVGCALTALIALSFLDSFMTQLEDAGSPSPCATIWLSPRQTIERILATRPTYLVLPLAMLGMVAGSVKKQLYAQNQIEVVSTLSRRVPIQLTGEYFGFPGPDLASMFRWARATQYDMFHNLDNDPKVHQDNIDAGQDAPT